MFLPGNNEWVGLPLCASDPAHYRPECCQPQEVMVGDSCKLGQQLQALPLLVMGEACPDKGK